ncbi:MAG TPA: DUF4232 domain-containing protein [Acidimicrobiales bacterium]
MKSVTSALAVIGLVASGFVAGGPVLLSATPASGAAFKTCVPSQIKVTHGRANGTAGTIYYPIIFTNTGAKCSIFGVPAIQPVTGSTHKSVGPMARNQSMGEMAALHTLSKGQSVSDAFGVVETGNFTASTCGARRAQGVLVSMGSFVTSKYVALTITVCTKRASTTTRLVAPGVTGN